MKEQINLSDEAMKMYCRIKSVDFGTCPDKTGKHIERTDPVMIDIVREIGTKRASRGSNKVQVELIPWSVRKYCTIEEYDGFESIEINVLQYKMDRIGLMMRPQPTELG